MSRCLCAVLCFSLVSIVRQAAFGDENARFTPTVAVIEKINTAIVPVFAQTSKESWGAGSGAVVHKDGFLLTADHVTRDFQGVALFGLDRAPFEIAGRLPERDLAVLKVDASK